MLYVAKFNNPLFNCRHRFKVSIDRGIKVYEAIEIVDGKPTAMGWRAGKVVQRPHEVLEKGNNIYVVCL